MGSSKKHKEKDREHKKKRKHRSRSRERSRSKEREVKRRHRGRDDDRYYEQHPEGFDREEGEIEDNNPALKPEPTGASSGGGGGDISLSIEETNKLRAKLGLKPLEVSTGAPDSEKESLRDAVHKPAESWTQAKKTEKIKDKLERSKQRREISSKLDKIKTLGESDSDEDAATWVRKNRMKQREKDRAEKTARMLEEMDEEFGIGNLVEEEFKQDKTKRYSSKDLKGLKVQHDVGSFKEGQTVILTLQDRGVLDEGDEAETLVNVNMIDNEKANKFVELMKKKPDYNPYDDAEEDEYGLFKPKDVLAKYDDEIRGEKKKDFQLGARGTYNSEQDKQMERITAELRAQSQTLSSQLTLASEYMTAEEAQAKFRKVKKKVRKIRKKKMLKADDLLPLPDETSMNYGSRLSGRQEESAVIPGLETSEPVPGMEYQEDIKPFIPPKPTLEDVSDDIESDEDDVEVEDLTGVRIDEDEANMELQSALDKARKLKQKKDKLNPDKIAERIKADEDTDMEVKEKGISITLNATSEFCRALGDIPTYGQSGNRNEIEKDELMELEKELIEERRRMEEEEEDEQSGWNRVEIDETPVNIEGEEGAILEDEPVLNKGIGQALNVAVNKGFLQKEKLKSQKMSKNMLEMTAQNYSIEDKRYDDLDEKYKKRDRYTGMLMDFKEKDSYKPEVKLEYVDESGRHLNQKEAFRQLSHRFHGKGSGKKKTEKRGKKLDEEHLMMKMSATDTPLNTVALLKEKQQQEKTPYILLTGNKGFTQTMVKPST
ncbi:U4/U6.U5 tri-snRNP-associated protein 1-like [Ruditapes philippinarum]|uniref:U4/U6.U5 tri-snRNP-associated protein 1-like n=1 Tax=Ruditapes philippinarum TaxID=129788 RepID=UPI00295B1B56|nr:U4/U6.U5 tri-snRNP-associated protein 1-like [Ruditapes philippinarum]